MYLQFNLLKNYYNIIKHKYQQLLDTKNHEYQPLFCRKMTIVGKCFRVDTYNDLSFVAQANNIIWKLELLNVLDASKTCQNYLEFHWEHHKCEKHDRICPIHHTNLSFQVPTFKVTNLIARGNLFGEDEIYQSF